jgi:hypothetical protein
LFAASAALLLRSRHPAPPARHPCRLLNLPVAAPDGAAVSGPGGRVPPGSASPKPEPASPASGRRD